jgi:uncharacterized protein YecE (DUF72 family)
MAKLGLCQILIGTSGWYYRDWVGVFYPKNIKSYDDLKFYAKTFKTVENNSAFYHMPQKATIQKWIKATPPDFTFSVKLNQSITHFHALIIKDETKELLKTYFDSVNQLQHQLGSILIQLPARFHLNLERLDKFLKYYTKHYPIHTAIEFRHQSWFIKDTYELLRNYNVALVIAQSSRYPLDRVITADFSYFRFHGPEKLFMSSYSQEQLMDWAGFIKQCSKKLKRIYIYFNNDWEMNAIKNGKTLEKLVK